MSLMWTPSLAVANRQHRYSFQIKVLKKPYVLCLYSPTVSPVSDTVFSDTLTHGYSLSGAIACFY